MRIPHRSSRLALALAVWSLGLGCEGEKTGLSRGSGGGSAGGGGGGTGGSGGSTSVCNVDFPCQLPYRCTSTGYQPVATNWDCHSICGPGPCSGATCEVSGPEVACPPGTRCLETRSSDISQACQSTDAGTTDTGRADAGAADGGPADGKVADLGLKQPLDAPECAPGATKCDGRSVATCDATGHWKANKSCPNACSDGACVGDCRPGDYRCSGAAIQECSSSGVWGTVATCPDTCFDSQCVESCTPGQQRCKDLEVQTCAAAGVWQDSRACLYLCSAGACSGECTPGARRCHDNTAQTCGSDAAWVDQAACGGSTPTCTGGQCVAACLSAGQDCTDPKTACCPGSECVSSDGGTTAACKIVPSCADLGGTCAANTVCCAGLDCTGGKCAKRTEACLEKPEDGVCGDATSTACCPGTVCGATIGASVGCAIPSSTKPQDVSCPRDQPSQHDACSAARFGLGCTYKADRNVDPWAFYYCICNYHGWSCVKNYYV